MPSDNPPKIIRAKNFASTFGIPDSTRADWENPKSPRYDPTFPEKMYLGKHTVGYFYDEVIAWLESRKKKSNDHKLAIIDSCND